MLSFTSGMSILFRILPPGRIPLGSVAGGGAPRRGRPLRLTRGAPRLADDELAPQAGPRGLGLTRGAARLADDELARQADLAGLVRFALDRAEQLAGGHPAELRQVRVDSGQRGPAGLDHHVPVVEPDERDVVGDREPVLAQRVGDAASDLVAAAEHRVERAAGADQDLPRRAAP